MARYKYPFIANPKLFKATMFACRLIRDNGFFNKDCQTAANYYSVDVDDVKKQVRLRQVAGQRNKNDNAPKREYKYFVVWQKTECDAGNSGLNSVDVIRSISKEPAEYRMSNRDYEMEKAHCYGGNYSPSYSSVVEEPFDTKDEAQAYADQNYDDYKRKFES